MKIERDHLERVLFKGERNDNYKLKTALSEEIRIHSNGDISLISNLLQDRFPSEPANVLNYRLRNISRITKTYFNKVISTLSKIERADDFVINGKDNKILKFISDGVNTYRSTMNWFFSIGLKTMLIEPNGLVLVVPDFLAIEDVSKKGVIELDNVKIVTYTPEQIVWQDPHFVILEEEGGKLYRYVDNNEIVRIEVTSNNGEKYYTVYNEIEFEGNKTKPWFIYGGTVHSATTEGCYESFVSGVVPFWNQALVEFSDKQAGIKQHVYPEKWRYQTSQCPDCNGSGKQIIMGLGKEERVNCSTCKGTGDPPTGMMSEIVIQQTDALSGGDKIPIPPAGYIAKDLSAIEFINEDYKHNIYAGLAAINMEFLMERPLNQSGVSKEMDRQELNSFIYQVASHIVENVLTPLHRIITSFYYIGRTYNEEWSVPSINTPVGFDFVSTDTYEDKLKKLRDSGMSTGIIGAIERRYIEKEFNNFVVDREYLLLVNNLDPLPAYTVEQKKLLYETKCISYNDYVASTNIEKILKAILVDNKNFYKKPYDEQLKTLYKYTQRIIKNIKKDANKTSEKSLQREDDEGRILDQGGSGDTIDREVDSSV